MSVNWLERAEWSAEGQLSLRLRDNVTGELFWLVLEKDTANLARVIIDTLRTLRDEVECAGWAGLDLHYPPSETVRVNLTPNEVDLVVSYRDGPHYRAVLPTDVLRDVLRAEDQAALAQAWADVEGWMAVGLEDQPPAEEGERSNDHRA